MRQGIKTLCYIMMASATTLSVSVFAQNANDILIYDNKTNDFLLPSYFDTPPQRPIQQEQTQPLVPQNVPADVDILTEIFGDQAVSSQPLPPAKKQATINTQTFYPTPKSVKQSTQQPLLTPLAPLPQVPEASIPAPKRFQRSSPYVTKLLAKESGKSKTNIQLPQDIRLQFNPGATQLTDPAVKWISAYALHVQKDPTKVINLRVSTQNWDVQQARLGIIMQIMMEKGLPARQIQIYQSNRDPDNVIIGYSLNPNQTKAITPEETKQVIKEQKTLIW